jgi:hypothetical protein
MALGEKKVESELKKKYGLMPRPSAWWWASSSAPAFFQGGGGAEGHGRQHAHGHPGLAHRGRHHDRVLLRFATMATRYSKVNGLVDYAEATVGSRYAYNIGWFMATLYTPCLVSVLAWVSARYTCVLLGWDITGGSCMTIACFFLCADFVMNALSAADSGQVPGLHHGHKDDTAGADGRDRHHRRSHQRQNGRELHRHARSPPILPRAADSCPPWWPWPSPMRAGYWPRPSTPS